MQKTRIFGIAGGQVNMRWKIREWGWPVLQFGRDVVLTIKMPIRRKDIFDIEALAVGISLGLLHPLEWIFRFLLCFKDGNGQGLGHLTRLNAEQIIGAARSLAPPPFGAGGFNRGGRFEPDPLRIVVSL